MGVEKQVLNSTPNEEKLKKLDGLLFQFTAKGREYDCVTRSFAPKLNVSADRVLIGGKAALYSIADIFINDMVTIE